MQSYCDERFIGIQVTGWETLVDVQTHKCSTNALVAAGQRGDLFSLHMNKFGSANDTTRRNNLCPLLDVSSTRSS